MQYHINGTDIFQIDQHTACVVTNHSLLINNYRLLGNPQVFCVDQVVTILDIVTHTLYSLTQWSHTTLHAELTHLLNWTLSYGVITARLQAIRQFAQTAWKDFQTLATSVISAEYKLIIDRNQLIKTADHLQSVTTHHWWDIFTGWSPSSTKLLNIILHPLLWLLISLIFILIVFIGLLRRMSFLYTRMTALEKRLIGLQHTVHASRSWN